MHSPHGSPSSRLFSQLSAIASTRASVVFPTPRGPHRRYPCATLPLAMAPRNVLETCDWTATSAKVFGRYLRASARDIARREDPRPDGATKDTACRCYLRGPDGVSRLTPSGTWGTRNISLRTADCGLRAKFIADCSDSKQKKPRQKWRGFSQPERWSPGSVSKELLLRRVHL